MATIAVYTNFGGHIVKENRSGTKRGYVPDPLGSTAALVDSTGATTDTWEYWPYGEVESHSGSSTTPFTFVGTLGYFRDLVSSLTYVRARFYQAFIGQWITVDSAWPTETQYSYCRKRLVSCVDATGLLIDWGDVLCRALCWALGAAICAAVAAFCTVGSVITVGGLVIACTYVIIAACATCAALSSICADICGEDFGNGGGSGGGSGQQSGPNYSPLVLPAL